MNNQYIEHVQRQFSDAEILEMGKLAAQMHEQIRSLEEQKKQAADHFKDEINQCETAISDLSTKITRGYEITPTPCDVVFDQPTKGMKQYICQRTLAVIKTVPMTEADRPGPLFSEE